MICLVQHPRSPLPAYRIPSCLPSPLDHLPRPPSLLGLNSILFPNGPKAAHRMARVDSQMMPAHLPSFSFEPTMPLSPLLSPNNPFQDVFTQEHSPPFADFDPPTMSSPDRRGSKTAALPVTPPTDDSPDAAGTASQDASDQQGKKKAKRNKPTLSCLECVERKTKVCGISIDAVNFRCLCRASVATPQSTFASVRQDQDSGMEILQNPLYLPNGFLAPRNNSRVHQ